MEVEVNDRPDQTRPTRPTDRPTDQCFLSDTKSCFYTKTHSCVSKNKTKTTGPQFIQTEPQNHYLSVKQKKRQNSPPPTHTNTQSKEFIPEKYSQCLSTPLMKGNSSDWLLRISTQLSFRWRSSRPALPVRN